MAPVRGLATGGRLVSRRAPDGSPDPVARSSYVRRYESEFAGRSLTPVTTDELVEAALEADVVLLGEYHPLPGAAEHAEALLDFFVESGRSPRLGIEFAQGRDQRALDAFLSGVIDAGELRDRIAWEREWGYPWPPAASLLACARRLALPVEGLDVAPRGGARDLGVRDRVVAARLARGLEDARRPFVVVFGEAHLASAHLPAALARELGEARAGSTRIVRILHDLPTSAPPSRGSAWSLDASTFLAFPAGPDAREGALTRVWGEWARARPAPRLEQEALLHALARMQLDALGVDPRRARLPSGGVLADLFPRLALLDSRRSLPGELRERGLGQAEMRALFDRVREEGALYVEPAGLVVSATGGVGDLARGAGAFGASALAARARPENPRRSPEGSLLLACVAQALARLADPVTSPAVEDAELAYARSPRLPANQEQARLLGGALGRLVVRGRIEARLLARAARRARSGAKIGRKALQGLVSALEWTDNC